MDQVGTSNIGRSKIPSGYRNAPIFKLTFLKTSATSGYWSSNKRKYTAANVTVTITYEWSKWWLIIKPL